MLKDDLLIERLCPEEVIKNKESGVNYEDNLRELLNQIDYFLEKTGGNEFIKPTSESHGECDCISESYELDLKMIACETMFQATSICTNRIIQGENGITYTVSPTKQSKVIAGYSNKLLRGLSCNDIEKYHKEAKRGDRKSRDVLLIAQTFSCNKNLLAFFPHRLFTNDKDKYALKDILQELIEIVVEDFSCVIEYRQKLEINKDLFIAFIYEKDLVIIEMNGTTPKHIGSIALDRSKHYRDLRKNRDDFQIML